MNLKTLYKGISDQLMIDFDKAAEYTHRGNMGDYRESALRQFLLTRMPGKFGIGKGEIIGFESDVSKQSDLIIYDKLESAPLDYDENVQAYPAGSIYGIIEVKSKLSKPKLLEGLENIKSVKRLIPKDLIKKELGGFVEYYNRAKPFGCIFAYSLDGNSLTSLVSNLREWEKANDSEFWPNMVVVLNEGIIAHYNPNGKLHVYSEEINASTEAYLHAHGSDTLFQFYSALLDVCNTINLPILELSRYRYQPKEISGSTVRAENLLVKKSDTEFMTYELTSERVKIILDDALPRGLMTRRGLRSLLSIQVDGYIFEIPELDLDEDSTVQFYLYDPEGKFLNREYLEDIIVEYQVWQNSFTEIFVNNALIYIPHICLAMNK